MAIGLGVLGIFLGGVWLGGGKVRENFRVNQAVRQFTELSQNLTRYSLMLGTTLSQSTVVGNGYYYAGVDTPSMIAAGFIPGDMLNNARTAIIHPWAEVMANLPNAVIITTGTYVNDACGYSLPAGITAGVGGAGCPSPPANAQVDTYEILFNGIPSYACVQLAMRLAGATRDPNIRTVFINNWSAGTGIQTFPISAATAAARCNPATNTIGGPGAGGAGFYAGTNSINIVYKFR